ncbi:MAG: response regulator, partial [Gemmatimonadetes bacterium]|nr:response regulator [Gemmatimonadota bacterium]
HAITLDIMMPGMDGWEAISRLKSHPDTADIPVIVVSIIDDKELGYRLGADEYLVKPVDRDALTRVLHKFEGRGKQVLICDDDPNLIELTRQLLEEDGWTVRAATNGQEALDEIGRERPDALLLDLMMPVMDGFETLNRLRAEVATADLPVIIITAKDLAGDELEALRDNASRVIEKDGLDRDRILRELRESMRTVRS